LNELNKRRAAYQNFFFPFAFIVILERLLHDDIVKGATQLNEIYYDDMDLNELINECLHLKAHIIQLADDKQNNVPKLLQILHEKNLISIYLLTPEVRRTIGFMVWVEITKRHG
jgi:hypothetical protein